MEFIFYRSRKRITHDGSRRRGKKLLRKRRKAEQDPTLKKGPCSEAHEETNRPPERERNGFSGARRDCISFVGGPLRSWVQHPRREVHWQCKSLRKRNCSSLNASPSQKRRSERNQDREPGKWINFQSVLLRNFRRGSIKRPQIQSSSNLFPRGRKRSRIREPLRETREGRQGEERRTERGRPMRTRFVSPGGGMPSNTVDRTKEKDSERGQAKGNPWVRRGRNHTG